MLTDEDVYLYSYLMRHPQFKVKHSTFERNTHNFDYVFLVVKKAVFYHSSNNSEPIDEKEETKRLTTANFIWLTARFANLYKLYTRRVDELVILEDFLDGVLEVCFILQMPLKSILNLV